MSYIYSCANCGAGVVKKPVGEKIGKGPEVNGLHGWKCVTCGPGAKVRRTMKG